MTDSHCHVAGTAGRHFICSPSAVPYGLPGCVRFFGCHPWTPEEFDEEELRRLLLEHPDAGVGEIGLDRLKKREIAPLEREVFERQLAIAAEFHRPVVLHGAKCWGETLKACKPYKGAIPAFLFHGFSRSTGLIPEIKDLGGFISIGPAVANAHAVNYMRMAAEIPSDMLLVETDRTPESPLDLPDIAQITARLAELRRTTAAELDAILDSNASRFVSSLPA